MRDNRWINCRVNSHKLRGAQQFIQPTINVTSGVWTTRPSQQSADPQSQQSASYSLIVEPSTSINIYYQLCLIYNRSLYPATTSRCESSVTWSEDQLVYCPLVGAITAWPPLKYLDRTLVPISAFLAIRRRSASRSGCEKTDQSEFVIFANPQFWQCVNWDPPPPAVACESHTQIHEIGVCDLRNPLLRVRVTSSI